ncbi:sensor histidine kinase [Kordiimonas aquimaris]|uniref:sensor histidine kinase n=1 Tax=Kordiimonas aquimaris TaxID=707591 RepID=UPI0021D0E1D9|nr:HAMP domain-containing sensor histidine kinase [Kordiimonas aquimaris]
MLSNIDLIYREQLKQVKATCIAQSAMVPAWALVFVLLISGIFPAIGDVAINRLSLFMFLIVGWGITSYTVGTSVDKWLAADKIDTASKVIITLFLINGLIGGFGFWLFWVEGHLTSNLFLCMVMLVIVSVYSIELNIYMPGFTAGLSSLAILIFARLVTSENEVANVFAFIVPPMIAWYFYMGIRGNRIIISHISTRIEKEALNDELCATTKYLKKTLTEAEVASKTKDTFFASMSHDLQTPLNAISGFNQVLHRQIFGPLNEKQREYTDHIQEATHHLQTLIKDVLTISSLRSGEYAVTCKKTDLRIPIQKAIGILLGAHPNAEHQLTTDIPDTPVWADIDADRFIECVLNLLTNAVKYTPEKAPISILVEVGNPYHQVHIIDSGEGMSEEDIEAAYKPFSRIKTSSSSGKQGTGLGLSIVKQLIEKQNGKFNLITQKSGGIRATLHALAAKEVP